MKHLLEFRCEFLQKDAGVKRTYFKVSARKKLCCTSSYVGDEEYTSLTPEKPPLTRQYLSIACKKEGKRHREFNCRTKFGNFEVSSLINKEGGSFCAAFFCCESLCWRMLWTLTVYAEKKETVHIQKTHPSRVINDTRFGKLLHAKKVFWGRTLSFLGIYRWLILMT